MLYPIILVIYEVDIMYVPYLLYHIYLIQNINVNEYIQWAYVKSVDADKWWIANDESIQPITGWSYKRQ